MIFPEYLNVCTLKPFGDLVDDGVRCDSRDGRSKNLTATICKRGTRKCRDDCGVPVAGLRLTFGER